LITTPLHGPAKAGPASPSSAVGTVGALVVVGAVVGFGVVDAGGVEPGFFEGAVVALALGGTVAVGVLEARCEGRTPEVAGSLRSRDFATSVAFFWLAMTGSATVTTASAAAISAANHSFLKVHLPDRWPWSMPIPNQV
jgi:hypothetical protein